MGSTAGAALNGWVAMVGRFSAVLMVFLVGLTLAGCYEVKEEVIPASLGEVIPFASDRADFEGGGMIIFSRYSPGNDYRFRDISEDGIERHGTFRAMQIKGNIYAVQARYDEESSYLILFYAIYPDHFQGMDIAASTNLKDFAARFGVEYHAGEFSEGFNGAPGKILAMLRAMGEVEFKP